MTWYVWWVYDMVWVHYKKNRNDNFAWSWLQQHGEYRVIVVIWHGRVLFILVSISICEHTATVHTTQLYMNMYVMTLWWHCDDTVMTLWWHCDDTVMTLYVSGPPTSWCSTTISKSVTWVIDIHNVPRPPQPPRPPGMHVSLTGSI